MNTSRPDLGFTKAARQARETINRLWLQNYIALFLRYSGFFLLGLIAYLHFFFDGINSTHSEIENWLMWYGFYLVLLELLNRKNIYFYESAWFITIRIFCNLLFVSWLISAGPLMREILVFAYAVPFISSVVYFAQNPIFSFFIYVCSVIGLVFGGLILERETPLTIGQVVIVSSVVAIMFIVLRQTYRKLFRLSGDVSQVIKKLQGSTELTDIVTLVCDGALMVSEVEGVFVLIIDPEDKAYIHHKVMGLSLSPSFEMDELIDKCNVIKRGQRYWSNDLNENDGKAYFGNFFTPSPRSIMIEPLRDSKTKIMGFVLVGSFQSTRFDEFKITRFREMCVNSAFAIETYLIFRKTRLSLLGQRNAAEQLLEADGEAEIVKILVEQASSLIGNADGCVLHLYENDSNLLIPKGGVKSSETGNLIPWAASYTDPTNLGKSIMHIGEGFAGHALLKQKLVFSDDANKHMWFMKSAQEEKITSLMSAPIIDPETKLPLGTISVHSKQSSAFTTEDQSTLLYLSTQGAISLARIQRSEEWRLRGGILKEIFESALNINFEFSDISVAQQLVDIAKRILPFGMVRLRFYDPITGELINVAAAGYPENEQHNLIGTRLPLAELEKFLKSEYGVERSYLIPSSAHGWSEFAEEYLYIPKNTNVSSGWDKYDAFFTPLFSETGDLIGYIAWDQPEDNMRPQKRIVEAVGAFASMAGWSIDLSRAYQRIAEQRDLIKNFIAYTTDKLEASRDKNIITEVAVDIGRERLKTEACSLYMVAKDQIELVNSTYLKNTHYIHRHKPVKAEVSAGLSSWVAATQKPLYFNSETEYQAHPGWAGSLEHLKFLPSGKCVNLLLVPIVGRNKQCFGVLSFENKLRNGTVTNFSDADIVVAINLAEELGLSLGLAEQLNNARELDQLMLEDDLHELKNQFYYGIQAASETSLFWLRNKKYKKAEENLITVGENSLTVLDELYNLHNTVKRKYYEIEHFRSALDLVVENFLHTFVGKDFTYEDKKSRVNILCSKKLQLSPLLRYVFIRILSGALMNSIKHSGFLDDSNVRITIIVSQSDGHIRLTVQDNGRGVADIKPGYGIGRMKDLVRFMRDKKFDVTLDIESGEEKGTSVHLVAALDSVEA